MSEIARTIAEMMDLRSENKSLRARLAAIEAERDKFTKLWADAEERVTSHMVRLAAVEALCDEGAGFGHTLPTTLARAAARGEGDRPAEKMIADVSRKHAAEWAAENRPNLGPVGQGDRPAEPPPGYRRSYRAQAPNLPAAHICGEAARGGMVAVCEACDDEASGEGDRPAERCAFWPKNWGDQYSTCTKCGQRSDAPIHSGEGDQPAEPGTE